MIVSEMLASLPSESASRFFFQHLRELIEHLHLSAQDERLAINYRNKYKGISANINSRLAIGIYRMQGTVMFLFMLPTHLAASLHKQHGLHMDEPFRNPGNDAALLYIPFSKLHEVFDANMKSQWLQVCSQYLPAGTKSNFRQHHLPELYELATNGAELIKYLRHQPDTFLLVNITWNSNNWQQATKDKSNHAWVNQGNTPHESWNFDFDNLRNPEGFIYGFAQFTKPPKVTGRNNLLIFYSDKKIVGFYGKAELLPTPVKLSDQEDYNLIGTKDLSLVLENKIENPRERGFMEDLLRVGQVGFSYLKKNSTVLSILKKALELNPKDAVKLNALINWVSSGETPTISLTNNTMQNTTASFTHPLNTILYGPPGTGKTFHTANKAVAIANPDFVINEATRNEIKDEYNRLVAAGQIQFVTFHQSLSYEDFIEGIKPVEPKEGETFLKYKVEDGIFKRMVEQASYVPDVQEASVYLSDDEFTNATFYSLGLNTALQPGDKAIYSYCIENECVALDVAEGYDATGKSEAEIKVEGRSLPSGEGAALAKLVHHVKTGNYVLLCDGESTCRAIGRVKDEYSFKPNHEITPDHFRSVQWLVKNVQIPREQLYASPFTYGLERLDRTEVKAEFFTKKTVAVRPSLTKKNYVLIIDEINRGNVSQIFGELITLIEADKRKGRSEALTVTLPYSKKPFSVPDNLYIIGTMNTADRSVEALDTALRRRFEFEQMAPNPALLSTASILARVMNAEIWKKDWKDKEWIAFAEPMYQLIGAPTDIDDQLSDIEYEYEHDKGDWKPHHFEEVDFSAFQGVNLQQMLETINLRLETLLSKDHTIGHAWLMEVYSLTDLQAAFKNKILPLLQEYFYNNYAKIGLVLGDAFFKDQKKVEKAIFASFGNGADLADDYSEKMLFSLKETDELTLNDFKSVYESKKTS